MSFFKPFLQKRSIPSDVNTVIWGTTIRWMGWGVVEALIPIFLLSFANSYAETGLLRSVYDIAFILAVPFVGLLIDKISARTVLIIGVLFYPFIGFAYFWAGATGAVIFVVIARLLNGVGYAFDSVGRSTYIRRHSASESIGRIFGYFDAVTSIFWIVCVVASIFLVNYFAIHSLFLVILPTSIICLFMFLTLNRDPGYVGAKAGIKNVFNDGVFYSLWNEIKSWSPGVRLISLATFFMGFVSVVAGFVIPLDAYTNGASITWVILIGAATALPSVCSAYVGALADRNRSKAVMCGMSALVFCLVCLIFIKGVIASVVLAFGLSLALNLVSFAFDGITTTIVTKEHLGRVSGLLSVSWCLGEIVAPIIIGVMLDISGTSTTFSVLTVITLAMFSILFVEKKYLKNAIVA